MAGRQLPLEIIAVALLNKPAQLGRREIVSTDDTYIRSMFDPRRQIPDWFWEATREGKQDRLRFRGVCERMERTELAAFMRLIDELADFFTHPPFRPPPPPSQLSEYLAEVGYWGISQGKAFFLDLWDHPQRFWDLKLADVNVHQSDRSYLGIPELVWSERYPEDDIPGHRQDE